MQEPRATGSLYTGLHSQSFVKQHKKRLEDAEDKAGKQAELAPKADLVFAEITKERDLIAKELGNIIHIEMPEQDVKAAVLGLKLADQRLTALSRRLENILRLPKSKEIDDAEL